MHAARAARRAVGGRVERARRTPLAAGGAATGAARRAVRMRPEPAAVGPSSTQVAQLVVPPGVDRLAPARRRRPRGARRRSRVASSRAFHATSALNPTEPTANVGVVERRAARRPLDRRDQLALPREPRRRASDRRARCRPSGGCRRSPTPTGGRAPRGPPAVRRRRCRRNSQAALGALDQLVVGRHPAAGELGDRVPVHRRLRDGGRGAPPPERLVRERAVAVAQVRHEAVVVLRRRARCAARAPPARRRGGPTRRRGSSCPTATATGRWWRSARRSRPVGVVPPRRLEQRSHGVGERGDGR